MDKKALLTLITALTIAGCSSVQTAKNSQGAGDKKLFSAAKDRVLPAMLASISSTGGSLKEVNTEECYILASYGATAWSWGEKVAIFCQEKDSSTEVEVVMKAAFKANVTAVNRAPAIFTAILNELPEDTATMD